MNIDQPEQQNNQESIEKMPNKVLMIDDSSSIIGGSISVFKKFQNFSAIECHSVEQALTAIEIHRPQTILLDNDLQNGSEGLEIARILQKNKPEIKIYTTTGNSTMIEQYTKMGIDHVDKWDIKRIEEILNS